MRCDTQSPDRRAAPVGTDIARTVGQMFPRPTPRRRVDRPLCASVPPFAVLAATAIAIVSGGCASAGGGGTLTPADYDATMTEICVATDARLDALPTPPEQIGASDWAGEVSRAFRAEASSASALTVDAEVRELHRSFVTTTQDLADQWSQLATALATDPDDIGSTDVEITALSLGRDDVATDLGLEACVRSER